MADEDWKKLIDDAADTAKNEADAATDDELRMRSRVKQPSCKGSLTISS